MEDNSNALVSLDTQKVGIDKAIGDTLNYLEFHSELSLEEQIMVLTQASYILACRIERLKS